MRRTVALAVALMVAVLALAASGCGGDDEETSSVDSWTESFCSDVSDWKSTVDELRNDFTADPGQFANEDALKDAANTVTDATDTLVSNLKDLGAPETESGEAVKSSLDSLETELDTQKANVEEAVNGISTFADVPAALSAVGTAFTKSANALQSTVDAIENEDSSGELKTAFDQNETCQTLTG